ncbi:hypothetical protein [Archangium lipolyticum]|uniref:hypothetical protein n=1 Tax=Archangium lipolyticum TaxID=2970465 RepID=UPI00214A3E6B|nr:hypothetical protein [Archangium lipolyticum]
MPEPRDTSAHEPGRFFRSPVAVFSLCALTFMGSALSVTGLQSIPMEAGRLRLLHVLFAMSPTLWVASVLVVSKDWRHGLTLWSGPWRQRLAAGLALLLAALLFLVPATLGVLSQRPMTPAMLERMETVFALQDFRTRFLIRSVLAGTVLMLHISGMFGVHRQLLRELEQLQSPREPPEAETLAEAIRRYQELRSGLERLLGFCAAAIGIAILISGALRSVLNELASPQELMPAESVVAFGVIYTWMLAMIYLPIRKTLGDVGNALGESILQRSLGPHVTWKQWFEERQAIRTWLGLQGSALQELQQGLSVLTPLFASVSSLAFGVTG